MGKNPLPFTKQDPSLIPTVGGCELHAWINNELGKKEYAINSTMEKSAHPRVEHMPRPWFQKGEPNVEVGEQGNWGSCAGQANHWAGRHFQSSAGKERQKRGGGGGMRQMTKPPHTVSVGKSQDWRHAGQPVHKLDANLLLLQWSV